MPEAASLPESRASSGPLLIAEGFEGPLDFLVEMVRHQQVDIGRLSILALIDQFVEAFELSGHRVPLERLGDWLVMASQLVLLRSQLLAPANEMEAESAAEEARRRLVALHSLARAREGALWLSSRPQLGVNVFGRGAAEHAAPLASRAEQHLAFLEALLRVLEGNPRPQLLAPSFQRARALELWRVPDALARLRAMLPGQMQARALWEFLPPLQPGEGTASLKRRAGMASTFVASLELARDGAAVLEQADPFGSIGIAPLPVDGAS